MFDDLVLLENTCELAGVHLIDVGLKNPLTLDEYEEYLFKEECKDSYNSYLNGYLSSEDDNYLDNYYY